MQQPPSSPRTRPDPAVPGPSPSPRWPDLATRSSSAMAIPSSARAARRLQAPAFQQSRRMQPCLCCIPRTRRRPRPSGYPDVPDASSSTPPANPDATSSCRRRRPAGARRRHPRLHPPRPRQ